VLEEEVLTEAEVLITRLGAMEFTDATQNLMPAVGTGMEALHFMIQVILVKRLSHSVAMHLVFVRDPD
jgi:hypothetical protein